MEVSGSTAMGKEAFLLLLTTQLKYQDPLAPVGSTEFVTQLAQFSQLEQMTGVNERLDTLVRGNTALNNYNATSLIGKKVQVSGGGVSLGAAGTAEINYTLKGEAEEVVIEIVDSGGRIVRLIDAGAQNAGSQTVLWDGNDFDGKAAPAGDYRFNISASDAKGETVLSERFSFGIVSGLVYEEGEPFLIVNGDKVPAASVVAVKGA